MPPDTIHHLDALRARPGRPSPALERVAPGPKPLASLPRTLLVLADALAVLATVRVATADPGGLLAGLAVLVPPTVLGAKVARLYDRDELVLHRTTLDEAPKLFSLATLLALLLSMLDGPVLASDGSDLRVLLLWLTAMAGLVGGRTLARVITQAVVRPERCLFVGDEAAAERFAEKLALPGRPNARVIGRIGLPDAEAWFLDSPFDDAVVDLSALLVPLGVDRVVVAPLHADGTDALEVIRMVKACGVQVSIVPRLFEAVGSSVEFDDVGGATLLGVRRLELTRSSRVLKRGFDVVLAGLGMVAITPVLALLALAVKLDSPGPVFFRQERVGRGGRRFSIFKFRTMVCDAEARKPEMWGLNEAAEGFFKIAADPRVTRVGRLLRRTALDELPQLLNVLRGEMSIVGPRPLIPAEDEWMVGWHRRRLELTPGMTGRWQLLGSSRVPMREMVAIDYLYIANWTLWEDIKILLRTVGFVAARRSH